MLSSIRGGCPFTPQDELHNRSIIIERDQRDQICINVSHVLWDSLKPFSTFGASERLAY